MADLVQDQEVLIGFGEGGAFVAQVAGVGDGFLDGAGEDYFDARFVFGDPVAEGEAAAGGGHVGEDDGDLEVRGVEGLDCFVAGGGFEDGEAAVAEIFGQRVARDDIALDEEDDRGGFRQWFIPFAGSLTPWWRDRLRS